MSRRILFILSLLLVFLGFVFFIFKQNSNKKSFTDFADHQKINIIINNKKLKVEVVNTPESIVQGLSGRKELGSDGMLFVFSEKQKHNFWMKEMKFDLDMVWIADNKIIDISENVPAPELAIKLMDLPIYSPKLPADMVLEIKAGRVEEWGVKIGDKVSFL